MIDQQKGIMRSVAVKAATELLVAEVNQGGKPTLEKWDVIYDHITERMTEEGK